MLAGLDAIPWHRLQHAGGPATNVPHLLRDLAADDPTRAGGANSILFGTLWNQHTVYEATPQAVPFLIELAAAESVHYRDYLLLLLASIASAKTGGAWVQASHEAAAAGLPVYLALVPHADPNIGAFAAYTLACFPERASEIVPALQAFLRDGLAAETWASVLLCLGILAPTEAQIIRLLADTWQSDAPAPVRLASALALARASQAADPHKARELLVAAAQNPGWGHVVQPWRSVGFYTDSEDEPDALRAAIATAGAPFPDMELLDFVPGYVYSTQMP